MSYQKLILFDLYTHHTKKKSSTACNKEKEAKYCFERSKLELGHCATVV